MSGGISQRLHAVTASSAVILPTGMRLYIYLGVAAAFLSVLTFAGCEHSNANSARADEKVALNGLATALDANKTNQNTINVQKGTIEQWKALATPNKTMKDAAARAAELEQENSRLNAALAKQAEKDYAKPDCVKLLETDFESVCPGIAAGLRERASRYENRVRGSAGAGGGENRPIFD